MIYEDKYITVFTVEEYVGGCRDDINSYSTKEVFCNEGDCLDYIEKHYSHKIMGVAVHTEVIENGESDTIDGSYNLLYYTLPTRDESRVDIVELGKWF